MEAPVLNEQWYILIYQRLPCLTWESSPMLRKKSVPQSKLSVAWMQDFGMASPTGYFKAIYHQILNLAWGKYVDGKGRKRFNGTAALSSSQCHDCMNFEPGFLKQWSELKKLGGFLTKAVSKRIWGSSVAGFWDPPSQQPRPPGPSFQTRTWCRLLFRAVLAATHEWHLWGCRPTSTLYLLDDLFQSQEWLLPKLETRLPTTCSYAWSNYLGPVNCTPEGSLMPGTGPCGISTRSTNVRPILQKQCHGVYILPLYNLLKNQSSI